MSWERASIPLAAMVDPAGRPADRGRPRPPSAASAGSAGWPSRRRRTVRSCGSPPNPSPLWWAPRRTAVQVHDWPTGADDLEMFDRVGARGRQHADCLATSSALPPPKPRTASQPDSVSSATPARTRSIDGRPRPRYTTLETPASVSAVRTGSTRDGSRPVTTRTRLAPSRVRASGTSPTRPAPKRTSAGTANWN